MNPVSFEEFLKEQQVSTMVEGSESFWRMRHAIAMCDRQLKRHETVSHRLKDADYVLCDGVLE